MHALVTGVAGFIGSSLALKLLREGSKVTGIDRLSAYYDISMKRAAIAQLEGYQNFTFHPQAIGHLPLRALMEGVDVIYHQAGQPGVRPSWGKSFQPYVDDNIMATQLLLEACLKLERMPRIVYASSSSVYGEAARYPCLETDVPAPASPYGVTKLAAEHLVSLYAHNYGLSAVSLRYFTVYGPGQRPDMAFTRLLVHALRGSSMPVFGTGQQIRDFTYIDDVVSANLAAATAPVPTGTVLNISGGAASTLKEVLRLVGVMNGEEVPFEAQDAVLGDVSRTGGDNASARRQLSWSPEVSLQDGLVKQMDWVRANLTLVAAAVDRSS